MTIKYTVNHKILTTIIIKINIILTVNITNYNYNNYIITTATKMIIVPTVHRQHSGTDFCCSEQQQQQQQRRE